ncbi:cyd operon protein YbgE [Vibrio viridaestus]|uniref:Cyd operon protein YbgE n=1 Tax=Vibrio viridaestus TaxID=2487322 RepID=A0A3N9TG99_9VIBR|nr:cyd operon protein YbgE [Vibrio viridaestus]RQW63291.1 cyd operon protein YbgE [Vibrio viridaestus]
MSEGSILDKIYQPIDRWYFRLLLIGMGMYHVGLLMWEPNVYADTIGGFNLAKVWFLIWGMCSSMIFGVGFKPRMTLFKIIFSPYISFIILLYFTIIRF